MYRNETKEKLESDKLLLKLHIKYIIGIALSCICLVIILSFCDDSIFKSCISVASTVASIILSVIAIILSVTGERTTNEIRNKVSDSVSQLEDCTNKSSNLSENLSATLQQLEALYENMNDKIGKIPKIESALNKFVLNNTENNNADNVAKHIISFVTNVFPEEKKYLKIAYSRLLNSGKNCSISTEEIIHDMIKNGADVNTAMMMIGLMMGNFCTGKMNNELMEEIVRGL